MFLQHNWADVSSLWNGWLTDLLPPSDPNQLFSTNLSLTDFISLSDVYFIVRFLCNCQMHEEAPSLLLPSLNVQLFVWWWEKNILLESSSSLISSFTGYVLQCFSVAWPNLWDGSGSFWNFFVVEFWKKKKNINSKIFAADFFGGQWCWANL